MTRASDNMRPLPRRQRCRWVGPGRLRVQAPAKLNLDLRVGPRRTDGMHPLDSLIVKVTLYDRIDLTARDDGQVRLRCRGADCGPAEQNLAVRAARRVMHDCPRAIGGVDIDLRKRVPPGAGLGGGSSDAAAVLWGLSQLRPLHLSEPALAEMAADLGSDVPLFLGPPAARMTGRGERLEAVRIAPFVAVVVLSGLRCRTGEVYRAFDEQPAPLPRRPARSIDLAAMAASPLSAWRRGLHNDLAMAAQRVCPPLGRLRKRLERSIRLPVHVTGSGGGLFVLCDDLVEARRVLSDVPDDLRARCVAVRSNPW